MSGMEGIVGGTKRKREYQSLEELLATPWCYYCDRSFSDDKVLHEHQKAKHFQCIVGNCHRRLNTAGGLRVHMQQVHKEELHEVDNAIEGRRDPNQEIFGTVGIPEAVAEQRVATLTQQYQALQREHRRKTGNPLPGEVKDNANAPATVSKTQQLTEGLSDIKARIAAAKAKKAAEKAALAAGGTLPTAATPTPPTTSVPMNGSATPEAKYEIKRENSQPAPTPAGFHGALAQTYPGSPMGWPGSATFAPLAPGYVNSASPPPWPPHLPVHPHAPPPQFQGGYVPPPVHNGINNGFVQSSSYGGAPRQQHALPILPPTPANLPQRPGLAPPRPGSNGLPPHPGHSNGQTLPTPTAAAIRPAEAQGEFTSVLFRMKMILTCFSSPSPQSCWRCDECQAN